MHTLLHQPPSKFPLTCPPLLEFPHCFLAQLPRVLYSMCHFVQQICIFTSKLPPLIVGMQWIHPRAMTLHTHISGSFRTLEVILHVVLKVYELCHCHVCHWAGRYYVCIVSAAIVKFAVRVCTFIELPCIHPILYK